MLDGHIKCILSINWLRPGYVLSVGDSSDALFMEEEGDFDNLPGVQVESIPEEPMATRK